MAPLHAAALLTGAKAFRDNPIIGSPRLNAAGLHATRIRIAHAMAQWRRRRLAHLIGPDDRAAFDRDGFVVKPNFLPPEFFEQLLEQTETVPAEARDTRQGDTITRRIALDEATLKRMPVMRTLARDKRLTNLLRYAGASKLRPLLYIQTIFSGVYAHQPDPQTQLHADTFHPTVKAWLFLQDVGPDDNAFVYVPGSHRLTPERLAWERRISVGAATNRNDLTARGSFRIEREELEEIGLPEPRQFAVAANTLVVADTCGFHARSLTTGARVRCEIWAYGRRNPFLPWLGFDPAGYIGVRGRAAAISWWFEDMLERMLGRRNTWRAAGVTTAKAPPDLTLHH